MIAASNLQHLFCLTSGYQLCPTASDKGTGSNCFKFLVNFTPIPLFLWSTLVMTAPPWSRMFLLWPVYSAGRENATIAWSLTRKDRHCLILIKAPPWLTLTLVPSRAWPNPPLKRCTWKLCLSLGYFRRSGASMISSTNRTYPEMSPTITNLLYAFSQKMQKLCMIISFPIFWCFFK